MTTEHDVPMCAGGCGGVATVDDYCEGGCGPSNMEPNHLPNLRGSGRRSRVELKLVHWVTQNVFFTAELLDNGRYRVVTANGVSYSNLTLDAAEAMCSSAASAWSEMRAKAGEQNQPRPTTRYVVSDLQAAIDDLEDELAPGMKDKRVKEALDRFRDIVEQEESR